MNEKEIVIERKARKNPRLSRYWLFCLNANCKLRENCFRYFATRNFTADKKFGKAVFPQTDSNEECIYYIEKRIERMAWGMATLYENVAYYDARKIRQDLYKILGSKRNYYRYNSGERLLPEEKQEIIRAVFRIYGYDDVEFEHYVETYALS